MALKEIKIRPTTDLHDLGTKGLAARRFLERGDQVKITVRFRGREIVHEQIGQQRVYDLAHMIGDVGKIRGTFVVMGKVMSITMDPLKRKGA